MDRPLRSSSTVSLGTGRLAMLWGLAPRLVLAATCACQTLADFERAPDDEPAELELDDTELQGAELQGAELGDAALGDAGAGADGAAPPDEPSVCTEAGRASAACEGTWRYRRWASCLVSDTGPVTPEACSSTPTCGAWNTCEDWSFGSAGPSTQTLAFEHRVKTCRSRGCFDACEEQAENILAAHEALREAAPEAFRDQVIIAEQVDSRISIDAYSPGLFEDDKYDELRVCTVTFELPSPATGQGAVCGCANEVCHSPACGADPNEFASPPGLTLDELRARDPALADPFAIACSVCDDMPSADAPARGPS